MLNAIKRESNRTYTENGAVTLASTYSDCLDLFATVGALRKAPEQEILDRFIRAYTEDPDKAMKIIFFARDIRGGLGERRVFRTVMTYLAANEPASVKKNIAYFQAIAFHSLRSGSHPSTQATPTQSRWRRRSRAA